MASFYQSSVGEFLSFSVEETLARLSVGYANRGFVRQFSDQTLTWKYDLSCLHRVLDECSREFPSAADWGLLLEFEVPRKESRIDIVLLIEDKVVLIETKSGAASLEDRRQIQEYALQLHYFHKESSYKRIIPILVSPQPGSPNLNPLVQREMFPQQATYWITGIVQSPWESVVAILHLIVNGEGQQIHSKVWDESPYHAVPSIIEAAIALRSGLTIREIAHSEASEYEIEMVRDSIQRHVEEARTCHRHIICFLTGVPGSGKTLVGLSLAHSDDNKTNAIHFMSGNGPLVKVLQHLFIRESRRSGKSAPQAKVEAKTLIENVHVFARYHTEENSGAPDNHAIIFDEAQRAWNRAQNMKKFKRNYSEPEMLLKIMERHEDWSVIIALVGGGQEINDGEAGLEEWGKALSDSQKNWQIYASPEVVEGGPSTAGHRLFASPSSARQVLMNSALHLRTSNRSLRAEKLAIWVNHLLAGDDKLAAELNITDKFPIFLSRDLADARRHLQQQGIGGNRWGLVGSSGAARLRAEGLEPSSSFHAEYPWEHWYLAEHTDVRSSYQCEVFATEFEIQGLELDWVGLCWGGDFVWDNSSGWQI